MTEALTAIKAHCMAATSNNPMTIMQGAMNSPFIRLHGPEHHVLVGSTLIAAYKNAGGDIELSAALDEMQKRGTQIPGGICGNWGSCGAAISTGMFISIITKTTPMSSETWRLGNKMTSLGLDEISKYGGPRCCKRDSFSAVLQAIDFVNEHFKVELEKPENVICTFSDKNSTCLQNECPYNENHKISGAI